MGETTLVAAEMRLFFREMTAGAVPAMMFCMTSTQSPSGNSSSELPPLLLDLRGGPRSPSSCSRLVFPGMRGGRSSGPYACSNAVAARDSYVILQALHCVYLPTMLADLHASVR